MNHNDVLRRLRFALDLEDAVVLDMFARSGDPVTPEELTALLMKEGQHGFVACPSRRLERFLDTLILDRRGPRTAPVAVKTPTAKEAQKAAKAAKKAQKVAAEVAADAATETDPEAEAAPETEAAPEAEPTLSLNEILKKIRIALDLKEDDVLATIELGDGAVTRPHLRGVFRNAGHKNYRECDEELLHAFLNGLTRKLRNKKE